MTTYVILGGGIAGMTVAEHIPMFDEGTPKIILISDSDFVKQAVNVESHGEALTSFDVAEVSHPELRHVTYITARVKEVDFEINRVYLEGEREAVKYDTLCIALGGTPNIIFPSNEHVYGIRDTDSVAKLQQRLASASHVTVVGNGGIATEFVHSCRGCDVTWVIRDSYISSVFIDEVAAKFFLDHVQDQDASGETKPPPRDISKRHIFTRITPTNQNEDTTSEANQNRDTTVKGSALGPDWYRGYQLMGGAASKTLDIQYNCEVTDIVAMEAPPVSMETEVGDEHRCDGHSKRKRTVGPRERVRVVLSNGKVVVTDVVVSATGVLPNTAMFKGQLELAEDGGILVDKEMRVLNHRNVFAVGDVCTIPWRESNNWKQMRLWTQARSQGFYAARAMTSPHPVTPDISFDIFTHSTSFFGFKVILLGRYTEWPGCECYFRVTSGLELVKLVVDGGRIQGALLVGETDLEETMENLILNQLDISHLGEEILDPGVDIEDYFD